MSNVQHKQKKNWGRRVFLPIILVAATTSLLAVSLCRRKLAPEFIQKNKTAQHEKHHSLKELPSKTKKEIEEINKMKQRKIIKDTKKPEEDFEWA